MTPEGKIKNRFNKRLKQLYADKVYRFMPVQTGYGAPGLDYYMCAGGYFVAVETKADKNKSLTPRQQATKAAIEAAGGLVLVVFDDDSIQYALYRIGKLCRSLFLKSTRR